ncbi:hypothetical protein LR48_Vigan10g098400 [Vigna angularis]|uniref:Uncharacterized protein n=2 Tax=Phaseolus angularis TaxID=3914 RepID=A0A0L9VJL4_PHAAN|nr:hypothetical protein LR48_Vigan10g098400 [Vigna angularis]BAT94965.1 hypothetical protein VIGAN_08161700 [Vigna angularis var. angularis]
MLPSATLCRHHETVSSLDDHQTPASDHHPSSSPASPPVATTVTNTECERQSRESSIIIFSVFLDFHLHHETLIRLSFSTTIKLIVSREILHQISSSPSYLRFFSLRISKLSFTPPLHQKPYNHKHRSATEKLFLRL